MSDPVVTSPKVKKPKKVKKPRKKLGGSGADKCQNCKKAVYRADKQMSVEGRLWHIGCFKCSYPGHDAVLSLKGFTIAAGLPYCKTHCTFLPPDLSLSLSLSPFNPPLPPHLPLRSLVLLS